MISKRICIIGLNNLYLMPYIEKYTQNIDCIFDIVYWNRHSIKENYNANNIYEFDYKMDDNSSKYHKLVGYLKFRRFAKKIISNNKYDGVVLLQTVAGILLLRTLERKFSFKYFLDIRDYTMELNPLFLILEKKLIKFSKYSVISSEGYKDFLPQSDYVISHNITYIDSGIILNFKNRKKSNDKIIISNIGLIRFHDQNIKLINTFKNDDRFQLRFIGKNSNELSNFVKMNNINNVVLLDRFSPEKTIDFYYETDIINNVYGNDSPSLDYALSNKLYYACQLGIPILVSPNTFMERVSKDFEFGISFDFKNPNNKDDLFDYYNTIEWDKLYSGCDRFLKKVKLEDSEFIAAIKRFIKEI